MKSQLPYELDDAVKRILRKNGVTYMTRPLIDNLGQLINWVIETEQAKASFQRGQEPLPLISLLGNMGIHGKSYVDKVDVQ